MLQNRPITTKTIRKDGFFLYLYREKKCCCEHFCSRYNIISFSKVKTVFFRKKKVTFDKVAKFNYELDTNEKLKEELKNLALCRNNITKMEYLSRMLSLFSEEGLNITLKELDMLLLLRTKTEQMLLERNE